MKCPLFTIMDKRTQLGEKSDYCECLKEECAWWQAGDEQCAILNLTEGIADAAHWLGDLACYLVFVNKRPHEEQFRR